RDQAPPSVTIAPTPPAYTNVSSITIDAIASDNDAVASVVAIRNGVQVGGPLTVGADGSVSATLTLGDGLNTIALEAKDRAGNLGSASVTVFYDPGAAQVTTALTDGAQLGPQPGDAVPFPIHVADVGATTVVFSSGVSRTLPRGGGDLTEPAPLLEGTNALA